MPITHYVSLDLGSETMAAYCEDWDMKDPGFINLQELAENLETKPLILVNAQGGSSSRLRTRIVLRDSVQDYPLPENHAELNYTTDYANSLFMFFALEVASYWTLLLPNPKIPFQTGAEKLIPKTVLKKKSPNDPEEKRRYPPEIIMQHLVTHVVRNFILKSSKLANTGPEKIHLTITIPNVYSVAHAKRIGEFVRSHTGIAKVDTLYESEAVAYYAFMHFEHDVPPALKEFRDRLLHRKDQKVANLVTIDIGRGTTDLSLIQIEPTRPEGRHFVLAQTGKSEGGNGLSYILVTYLNKKLEQTAKQIDLSLPFSFLEIFPPTTTISKAHATVLLHLEEFIDKLKASFSSNYKIDLPANEQTNKLRTIIGKMLEERTDLSEAKRSELVEKLVPSLILPRRLPGDLVRISTRIGLLRTIARRFIPSVAKWFEVQQELLHLRSEIDSYVKRNVEDLMKDLVKMAVLWGKRGWKKQNCRQRREDGHETRQGERRWR